jgi:outer membrane protein
VVLADGVCCVVARIGGLWFGRGIAGLVLMLAALAPVRAGAVDIQPFPANRIGALAGFEPSYPGANTFRRTARPDIDVTFDNRYFVNTDNGLGIYLLNEGGWTFGPSIFTRLGRYHSASSTLQGLPTVKTAPQARVSGGYDFGLWDVNLALSHDTGGSAGTTLEFKAGAAIPLFKNVYMAPTLNALVGDRRYMDGWYGVSVPASANSRFRAYAPRGGLESVGGTLSLFYVIDRKWAPFVKAETHYLLGPAGNSPLTATRWQQSIGAGVSYLFD